MLPPISLARWNAGRLEPCLPPSRPEGRSSHCVCSLPWYDFLSVELVVWVCHSRPVQPPPSKVQAVRAVVHLGPASVARIAVASALCPHGTRLAPPLRLWRENIKRLGEGFAGFVRFKFLRRL